ncbi:putative transcription factor C2H2 family [Rosa chinensis]|uniref:Putative transcription factor C2H2 family n=2 Tax=Rosa chinensis TaxID=74649 RepID=A0A2P6S5P6_ROSCH|nr:putative transcription factor C2H2 family [Rosa chinensis]
MSALGVPLGQQPPILEKLFQVVQAAVPERRIIVVIADVTVRLLGSFDEHHDHTDISRLTRECPITFQLEFTNGTIESYALSEVDYHGVDDRVTWESFETHRVRFVPATTSSIMSLQKVRTDSLEEETIKQNPSCAICINDFTEAGVDQLITLLPCAHHYHLDCIVPWLKTSHLCPLCRYPMPTVEEAESSNLSNP